ncbi:DUF1772 domain-containing protein [Flavivirga spongiicola]|uniref:DUF1772 domain-containing protein n=1 Tax=Flavivirga spongiicola TaxID=421621 RepID=A0ABU7XYS9_9FLAO|nr:DUF1772 domain-containing protein [Flavivirga sp. MEBiC05379]MDO5980595.1 DUF1772 domain-containing protein [Flavivirga sp. MEBiC05379]
MDFTFQNGIIIALILLTGLSAGLCFTWTNTVTPGIGRLSDLRFLMSFQQMNRTILNPIFFIVFFGPFFLSLINFYVLRNASSLLIWLLILAAICYFFGVILITIFGNVPLNEMLDKTDLNTASIKELKSLRENFEVKWNRLHLIRTLSAIISFLLLIISLIQVAKSNT